MLTANTAASAKSAPAMKARINVSLVDMKILDSPASTIFTTNSDGLRYDIGRLLLFGEVDPYSRCQSCATARLASGLKRSPRTCRRTGAHTDYAAITGTAAKPSGFPGCFRQGID